MTIESLDTQNAIRLQYKAKREEHQALADMYGKLEAGLVEAASSADPWDGRYSDSSVEQKQQQAPAPEPATPEPATPEPATPEYTQEQVRAEMVKVAKTRGKDSVRAILDAVEAPKLSAIPESKYADVIALARAEQEAA